MLVISLLATRKKDKGAAEPNLRETHRGGLTLVPIVISINKSPVPGVGEGRGEEQRRQHTLT